MPPARKAIRCLAHVVACSPALMAPSLIALALMASGAAPFLAMMASAQGAAGPQDHRGALDSSWTLATDQFDNSFEAEPYIGNGYIGLRVPAAGTGYLGGLGKVGWPIGTERIASAMAAGVYSKVADGTFYKEQKQAIALIPNWSTLTFGDSSGTYSPATVSAKNVSSYRQVLDLRAGAVTTSGVWTAPDGNKTRFSYRVAADRAHAHRALVTLEVTPAWTGKMAVGSLLDGAGARRLDFVSGGADAVTHTSHLTYKSKGTGIQVSEAAILQSSCKLESSKEITDTPGTAGEQVSFDGQTGRTCKFSKYVAMVTGRDSKSPEADAIEESKQTAQAGLAAFERENRAAWDRVWDSDIEVDGDPTLEKAIRANEYTLFASIREDSPDSLGPSGLSSDGYAGMVFWDADTWMFPALLAQHPELGRVMVDYRSNTLPAAKKNASDNGYRGAMYPWTSGMSGDMGDECYGAVTDATGKVIADPNKSCTQQLHLQSDVALAQWLYYEATGDKKWLAERGWPVLEAVAQFWESKVTPVEDGYAINNVQTPDEYATDTNNDAFTNAEVALELRAAIEAAKVLNKTAPSSWAKIADGVTKTMKIDAAKDIFVEHEGYNGEKIKQADVVMLTYPLDYSMSKSMAIDDLNYYTPRTDTDGPAMTDAIHSIAAAAVDAPGCSAYTYMVRSYEPFIRAPYLQFSEFAPVKLSETSYDFLTGVGGFMQEFLYGFSGFRPQPHGVRLDPNLPPQLASITLRNMQWQGRTFTIHIGPMETTVTLNSGAPLPVFAPGGTKWIAPGTELILPTRRADLQRTDNVVRCGKVTANSSQPGSPAVAAVDGIPATAWVATKAQATLTVKLDAPISLNKVRVSRGGREPFPYSVEVSSDGAHWKTVANAPSTATGSGAGSDELAFAPIQARFIRLDFPGAGDAKPPNIAEFEAFSSDPKPF